MQFTVVALPRATAVASIFFVPGDGTPFHDTSEQPVSTGNPLANMGFREF
jgi:hypothetical protein